jgi:hypothetical protein
MRREDPSAKNYRLSSLATFSASQIFIKDWYGTSRLFASRFRESNSDHGNLTVTGRVDGRSRDKSKFTGRLKSKYSVVS